MTLTAFVFPRLRTSEKWLAKCLKTRVSENPSASNMVNLAKHSWNQHRSTIIIFTNHCQRKMSWKRSPLLTGKILGLLVYTLAGDEMYLVLHRNNLMIAIQMQLSQKKKNFFSIFGPFFKSIWNFERFEKKDNPHRFCVSEITDSKNVIR